MMRALSQSKRSTLSQSKRSALSLSQSPLLLYKTSPLSQSMTNEPPLPRIERAVTPGMFKRVVAKLRGR